MTSLRCSGGGGDGGGGSSGGGGGRPSSRCGAAPWGVSGCGRMRLQQRQRESLPPQQLREWYTSRGGGGGRGGCRSAAVQLGWYVQRGASQSSARCPYVIRTGDRAGQTCGTVGHTQSRCLSYLSDTWRAEFGDAAELPCWLELVRQGVDIFALDYDAILTTMYALSASVEGDCYRGVPPDPGIAAAALGASESGTLPGTAHAKALHTFTLDSGASRCFFRNSTTLTPLPAPVPVRLAHPSGGPVVARSSTVLPCPAVPSGSLSGLHLPSFSTNLVSTTALQDAMVTTTTPVGQRVSICTCTRTGRHLATFTRRPGSSLYTLATEPPQVAASTQVSASGQVAASCSCRLLSHQTLLWHHRLGHPYLPRLHGMHSPLLTGGAEPGGAETGGAEPGGAESGGAEPLGAEPGGTEPGGAELGGTEPGGAESARVASRGASSRREVLSPRELREWFARRWGRAAGAGGTTAAPGPGGTAEAAGVGPTGGSAGASGGTGTAGSAGTGATGVGATGGVGAGGSADAGTSEGAGAGAPGAGGATGAGAPTGSPGTVLAGSGGAPRPRPYFVPLLEQVLGLPPSPGPAPPLECP
ncbi:unnamed protein product [Closterium sp. NIES-53]